MLVKREFSALFLAGLVAAGATARDIAVIGRLDWENMRIDMELRVPVARAETSPPSGRLRAEEALFSSYLDAARPFIHSVRLDSSGELGSLVASGGLPASLADTLALQAERKSPAYSSDFGYISSSFTIDLKNTSAELMKLGQATRGQIRQPPRLIDPLPVAAYTGIIVIADGKLPVHGKKTFAELSPCLFPKIWDTEMNLIYDKNMAAEWGTDFAMARYSALDSVFQNNPSGLSDEIRKVVGVKPLRVIAREVFGINPTDPVIDRADALTILSSEANRRLLNEGRVVFIVPEDVLVAEF
ncbi:MAG: polymerase [Spirochaetaceae bacterium]|jgi:hypothetical protein|nr:polymerase [Spirochaetaceae bacterium]